MTGILAIAPFAIVLAASAASLVADAFAARRIAVVVALIGLMTASALSVGAAWSLGPAIVLGPFAAGGAFSAIPAVVFGTGALALAGGWVWFARTGGASQAVIICLAALSSGLAAASTDLTTTFVAIEGAALAGYALVIAGRTRASDEAAVKYFVQGAIAASLLVLGLAGVLASISSTSLGIIDQFAPAATLPMVGGVVLFVVGLLFKAGAFPFHAWVPDAYDSAPAPNAAFLAAGPKAAALMALGLLAFAARGEVMQGGAVQLVIVLVAAASIVFGNLVALRQRSYQRMLAYSGIAQAGYALVAVAAGVTTAAAVMIATYALAAAGAFLVAQAVRGVRPDWDGTVAGMNGLARQARGLSLSIAVIMLSLTGVPPLFGFWGKLEAFGAAVSSGLVWLALLGMIGSVVSFGYYGGVLRAIYFERPESDPPDSRSVDGTAPVIVALCAVGLLALGAAPLVAGVAWLSRLFAL